MVNLGEFYRPLKMNGMNNIKERDLTEDSFASWVRVIDSACNSIKINGADLMV